MANIVIHGQNLNLENSGGAGRYCEQLCNGFRTPKQETQLASHSIYFTGFQQTELVRENNERQLWQRSVSSLKNLVYRSFPPFLYDYLLKAYTAATKSTSNSIVSNESFVLPEWSHCTVPTLFHELTNYGVCDYLGRMAHSSHCLVVVTFLDLQDYYYPEYFSDRDLIKRRLTYSFYKDRSQLFFSISNFTKQSMIERLSIPEEKIIVTHLAADDLIHIPPSKEVDIWAKSFDRYWFYPAKAWKHKNHDMLFKAVSILRDSCKKNGISLLLSGGFSQNDFLYLQGLIRKHGIDDLVKVLGFVNDAHLQALIRNAEYMIFPSLFEGFGMPILEAMSLGCPVLSSNAGSLPEIGGDAAIYFDAQQVDSLVALLGSILQGKGPDRESLISAGYDNCKRFSWEMTYKKTIDGYKMLLG